VFGEIEVGLILMIDPISGDGMGIDDREGLDGEGLFDE
jgi:hypothetical protein